VEIVWKLLFDAMAYAGVDEIRQRLQQRGAQIHDLADEPPSSVLHATFRVRHEPRPFMVMVGLRRGDRTFSAPVQYGERLRVRLSRGVYQVTAWFLADLPGFLAPTLVAIADQEIRILSERPERYVLVGSAPTAVQLAEIRAALPPRGVPITLPSGPPALEAAPRPSGPPARIAYGPAPERPEIEIIRTSCAHTDSHGVRCPQPALTGKAFCPAHTARDERFQIVGGTGITTPPPTWDSQAEDA